MTLGELAMHLASIPAWGVLTLREPFFDLSPPGAPPYAPPAWQSLAQTLAVFDEKIAKARAALVAVTDLELAQPWTLKKGGEKVFTAPRGSVLRSFVLNHSVHHRAQLGVYLRMLDVPVPAMYGPTADTRVGGRAPGPPGRRRRAAPPQSTAGRRPAGARAAATPARAAPR